MAKKPATKMKFVSPLGTAQWPHIIKPDTEGKYATGKYTTKLVMTPAEAKPFMDFLKKAAADLVPDLDDPNMPFKKEMAKDETGKKVPTGNIVFTFSSKFAPGLIDPKNAPMNLKALPEDFYIGGGSRIRVAGEIFPYDKGISLQMQQVQIASLVQGRASLFDEIEGDFDGSEFSGGGVAFSERADNDAAALGI